MENASNPNENSYWRHDMLPFFSGAAIVAIGVLAQGGSGGTAKPSWTSFERDGLTVQYPKSNLWQGPTGDGYPAIILSGQCSMDPKAQCGETLPARIEVRVSDVSIDRTGAADVGQHRQQDYASGTPAYKETAPDEARKIGEKEWTCGRFSYVPKGASAFTAAIECATVNNDKVYIVTLTGPDKYLGELESQVIGTLALK